MKTIRLIITLLSFVLIPFLSFGQETEYYTDIQDQIRTAKELFRQEKYNSSFRQFEKIQEKVDVNTEIYSEAEYFKSYALLKSGQGNGDKKMSDFIEAYPESPYLNQARFNLGSNQFEKNRYSMAIRTLNQVDAGRLDGKQAVLLHYQLGYSYMEEEDLENAAAEFYQIKDANNLYSKPASYYWAHINYLDGNYESALNGLRKLDGDPTYSQVIPLYVSHIFYKQQKYADIVNYTTGIIDDVDEDHQPELAKIIGDSYFHLNEFEKAIPYLERYHNSKGLKSNEDNYLLGYCYYNAGEFEKAIPYLEKASKGKDELAQNAFYHLSDCYVRTDNKEKARLAFEAASEMDFNDKIKEDALFNYAKITYELSYSPFSETIKAFDKYISLYPNSERNNSAYQYLVEVYMVTKNYEDAIKSIEKIEVKNASINKAYQRVTFFRGLELFNDRDYNSAIVSFDKTMQQSSDRELKARAMYWRAESLYRLGDFNSAINQYSQFLLTPGAYSLEEFKVANYNLAYAYFELEDYNKANSSFRKYLSANEGVRSEKVADALNRLGDCYFLERNYDEAIQYYRQSNNMRLFDADYALFQIAFCEGLQRNYQDKVTHLRNLLADYPNSNYRDDALYELGRAYERIGQNNQALELYNDIVKNYKQSSYYKKAVLQLGLVNFNNGNLNQALKYYKEVVEDFPNTDEAAAALTGIKNTYVELNNVDAYFAYTRNLGRGEVSASEQDALSYQAAEKQFMSGDADAIPQLRKYLNDFPYGNYVLNTHFYLGEALYAKGSFTEALGHYEYVANQSDNLFSEPAVSKAAELIYNAQNYQKALGLFQRLETISSSSYNNLKAYVGQMNCQFKLGNYNEAIPAAQKVQTAEKANPQLIRDADYVLAKSYYNLNNSDKALDQFRKLATETNSAEGAEAKFLVAQLLFVKNQLKPAEDEIMDFISKGTPHQFWLGKSFILLADIYQAQGDEFQAKHTLRSVVENYGNNTDGIIRDASEKLAVIEAKEKAEQEEAKNNPVEINIDNQENNQ